MYPLCGPSNRQGHLQAGRMLTGGANGARTARTASPRQRVRLSTLGVGEAGERLQVGQALAALGPPGPFPPDGGREAEFQRGVEVLVGVAEHAAEQPVDVLSRNRR